MNYKNKNHVTIAIASEIAPAKTIIPIIERLKFLESEGKLNWRRSKIIGLYHGNESKDLLYPYCDSVYSIGHGRSGEKRKRNNIELGFLIGKDMVKAVNAMKGKGIDLLITSGNAGDVRKSIFAANILRIPVLHIEQDIYNPIEIISHANIVTVPSQYYENYLREKYKIKNVANIGGYPMATYVHNYINSDYLKPEEEIIDEYGFKDYMLVLLGGDLKHEDIGHLIHVLESLNLKILIVPFRFEKDFIESFIVSPNIKVLEGYVDVLSFLNGAKSLIYGAGMGITIESGVLKIPSIKIKGFHETHGSVDLANNLKIPIVKIDDIPSAIYELKPPTGDLLETSKIAIDRIVMLINNFDKSFKKSGFKSTKIIWKERSKFR